MAPNTPLLNRSKGIQTLSPSNAANSCARRRRDTALLQSPARRSHSACMRQIFDSKQQHPPYQPVPPDMIYPSLPNVSRPISPNGDHLTVGKPTGMARYHRLGQSGLFSKDATKTLSPVISHYIANDDSPPSESWSGDSGYLGASGQSAAINSTAASSVVRVSDWLSATFDISSESLRDVVSEEINQDRVQECGHSIAPNKSAQHRDKLSTNIPIANREFNAQGQRCLSDVCNKSSLDDLQAWQAQETSNRTGTGFNPSSTPTDRAGPGQFGPSPLSPNICTERGPSRFHRNCRAHCTVETSPSKLTSFRRLQRRRLQENLAPDSTAFRQDLLDALPV